MKRPPFFNARVLTGLLAAIVGLAGLAGLCPRPAAAHGLPPALLALWGPFARPVTQCQRQIGSAAQRCFGAVIDAERRCKDTELAGQTCDSGRRDALIATTQTTNAAVVQAACLGGQLTELRFADFDDARADVGRACGRADIAIDLMYAPMADGAVAEMSPADRQCVRQTAAVSAKLLQYMTRAKGAVLNQIAARNLLPSVRFALLGKATNRIARARAAAVQQLAGVCADFQALYGQDAASYLSALELRADCVVGIMYVQLGVPCQLPYCGNRTTDPGEECDDGNAKDDDACLTNCTLP